MVFIYRKTEKPKNTLIKQVFRFFWMQNLKNLIIIYIFGFSGFSVQKNPKNLFVYIPLGVDGGSTWHRPPLGERVAYFYTSPLGVVGGSPTGPGGRMVAGGCWERVGEAGGQGAGRAGGSGDYAE